jgi:hypothetical protein
LSVNEVYPVLIAENRDKAFSITTTDIFRKVEFINDYYNGAEMVVSKWVRQSTALIVHNRKTCVYSNKYKKLSKLFRRNHYGF